MAWSVKLQGKDGAYAVKMLVTGGAGFIGCNFIAYMLRRHPSWRIVCLDKLTYAGSLENLADALSSPDFSFVRGDICDRGLVYGLCGQERFDAVINFAAESHVDRSIEEPGVFLHTNILGTGVLLDACRRYGVRRFHQISTDEVYGDMPLNAAEKFTEASPLRPSSPYSSSKASADLLALAYARTYNLPVIISRSSNNYGPHQFPEKLIPLMIKKAAADEALPVYGDGRNLRDWLHVQDHCRALDLLLQRGRAGEIYNIAGSCELSSLEIARHICRSLGKPESLITHVADRRGHDLRYAMDCGKIRNELGWRPQTDFGRGLEETIAWYRGQM